MKDENSVLFLRGCNSPRSHVPGGRLLRCGRRAGGLAFLVEAAAHADPGRLGTPTDVDPRRHGEDAEFRVFSDGPSAVSEASRRFGLSTGH